eukprot:1012852_1
MKKTSQRQRRKPQNALYLILFCLIAFVVCTSWFGYHIQSQYITHAIDSEKEYNELLLKYDQLSHKLKLLNEWNKTKHKHQRIDRKWHDESYLLGHDHWVRGLAVFNKDPFYEEIHECYSWQFSQIYGRVVTVQCNNQKHGVHYFEHETLFIADHRDIRENQWIAFNKSDDKQYSKQHNQYILYLDRNTQITWIRCNFHYNYHLSVLPLRTHLPREYTKIKKRYDALYDGGVKPPNVVLFVLDSMSRSNFMRSSAQTVAYLSTLMTNEASPVSIYQFFRHSTIGWGTSINLGALLGRNLSSFYERMGYYVPGLYEWRKNDKYKALWQDDSTFALSTNFGNEYCWVKQREDVEMFTQFVIQSVNELAAKDGMSYFVVLHSMANHAANGAYAWNLDRHLRRLVEYVSFENTIVHIVGDHGCLVGDSTTNIYGRMEARNPVSILIVPKHIVMRHSLHKYLHSNQQRLVTHYDFHRFYKSIPLLYSAHEPQQYSAHSKGIMTEYIARNRSCDGVADGFCFCDTKHPIKIEHSNAEYFNEFVSIAIDRMNDLTGNGQWNCITYDPSDFVVVLFLQNELKTSAEVVIEKRHRTVDEDEYQLLKQKNRWLSFVVEFRMNKETIEIPLVERSKWKIPAITRIDWFKYETCLITHYDPYLIFPNHKADQIASNKKRNPLDGLHPVFKDHNLTR